MKKKLPLLLAMLLIAPAVYTAEKVEKHAYFGETHVHTSWSFDAFVFGDKTVDPEAAFRFGRGDVVNHPVTNQPQKLKAPLDFMAVTDHAEYMGIAVLANKKGSWVYKLPEGAQFRTTDPKEISTVYQKFGRQISLGIKDPILDNEKSRKSIWDEYKKFADKYYVPGKFTTFVGYEWTSTPKYANMHRNVIFEDSSKLPVVPFTSVDSSSPEDLWVWMDEQRKKGIKLLAIPHNSNISDGLMFPIDVDSRGKPLSMAWAQSRMINEPLVEMHQLKGNSEAHYALSPSDEFANFELIRFFLGGVRQNPRLAGAYVREGLLSGLALSPRLGGVNPYKMGFTAGSDTHTGLTVQESDNYAGGHDTLDATPNARLSGMIVEGMDLIKPSVGGLAGVWAEKNDRPSIFAAMQRKETFATSGVRIKVRMFGSYDYSKDILNTSNWLDKAYTHGVPMGGDLLTQGDKSPTFIVWAEKDPNDGNLDRIQIVKGWAKDGQTFQRVYDVVWSDNRKINSKTGMLEHVKNTVDVKKASYTNTSGAVALQAVWTDPDYDANVDAFYYARVLQIPTPRWSTYDAKTLGIEPPKTAPASIQQRAWGSPIWVTSKSKKSKTPTVTDISAKGAKRLENDAIANLVIGTINTKKMVFVDNVTNAKYTIDFRKDGTRSLKKEQMKKHVDMSSIYFLEGERYSIANNAIILENTTDSISVALYEYNGKIMAAFSNEFGHVNYEVK